MATGRFRARRTLGTCAQGKMGASGEIVRTPGVPFTSTQALSSAPSSEPRLSKNFPSFNRTFTICKHPTLAEHLWLP